MINVQRKLLHARMKEFRKKFLMIKIKLSNLGEHLLGIFSVLKTLTEHLLRILRKFEIKVKNVITINFDRTENVKKESFNKRVKLEESDSFVFNIDDMNFITNVPKDLNKNHQTIHQLLQLMVIILCSDHICLCQSCQSSIVEEYMKQAKYAVQEEIKAEILTTQKDDIIAEYRATHESVIELQAHEEFLIELKIKQQDDA